MNSRRTPFNFYRALSLYQQFEAAGGYERQEALKRGFRDRLDTSQRQAARNVVIFIGESRPNQLVRAA